MLINWGVQKYSICGIRTHALSADDLKSPPLTARARYSFCLTYSIPPYTINHPHILIIVNNQSI